MAKGKREWEWETVLVAVTPEMKRELERVAKVEVTSMSALVRRAITAMYMPAHPALTSAGREVER